MKSSATRLRALARVIGALTVALAAVGTTPVAAAEVRVFAGGAPQETLEALAPEFQKRTGHTVKFTFAHVSVIQKKLAAGEQADVVLLPVPLMANMDKAIGLRPEGRSVIARIGIGVVIREGANRPDLSNADAVRKMLLAARAIAVPAPEGLTGSHLMRMMDKLGIAEEVRKKLLHKPAIDRGAEFVASGEADVGLYLASEVLGVKGAALAGMLPAELQNYVVYAIAVPAKTDRPEPAMAFLKFVSDPANREAWKITGFELVEGSR